MSLEITSLIDCRCRLGESILWHQDRLWWLDLVEPEIFSAALDGSDLKRWPIRRPAPLGAIVPSSDPGRLLLSHREGVAILDLAELDGVPALEPLANPEAGRDGISGNDAKTDRFGRLWVGTCDVTEKEPRGALWCIPPRRGAPVLGDAGFIVSNGPAVSPDGRKLYFSDTFARQILAYDLTPEDPHPRNRRVFCRLSEAEGYPDGLTVDAEGGVWIAHWGGARISRWSPEGQRLLEAAVPAVNVTALAFCGPDLDRLVITSAWDGASERERERLPQSGNVFVCNPGMKGLAETPYPLD